MSYFKNINFDVELALGNIEGQSGVNKFGANKEITAGSFFKGSILCDTNTRPYKTRPKKNRGLPRILYFLPNIFKKNPNIMKIGANAVNFNAISWAVNVVPTLLPKMIPKLLAKEIRPALTKLTVITIVVELDCTIAVTKAPKTEPITGVFVTFLNNFLNLLPARCFISCEKLSIPYKNKINAGITPKSTSNFTIESIKTHTL